MAGEYGGKRAGAGRKKKEKPQEVTGPLATQSVAEKRNTCQRVIEALANPEFKHCAPDSTTKCMQCLLMKDCREMSVGGAAMRRFVTEGAEGKAVHHVNHMHDKPLEMNVNVKLSEIIRAVRERKREYERTRG